MKLEPMTAPEAPVLTKRLPEPAVEVAFAARLTERDLAKLPVFLPAIPEE